MSTQTLRFGILVLQDAPFPTLAKRWRRVEDLGFDHLWVADHSGDYRDADAHWFDGWTVLAAMAAETSRIRIGSLVSNPILRPPALLAKEAVTLDHLSEGRLELGVGMGIAPFDHAAMGIDHWSPAERADRFAEYLELVDGLLRSPASAFSFEGRYYRAREAPTEPHPWQHPRPPISVGGQSPTALMVAAERADCWNTHGPFGLGVDKILEITHRQNDHLDQLCAAGGRDPMDLRRSLLLFQALDPWSSPGSFENIVTAFSQAGIGEFVCFWPGDDRLDELEQLAAEVIPMLRQA